MNTEYNKQDEFDFEEYKRKTYERAQILLCGIVVLSSLLFASFLIVIFNSLVLLFN